MAVVPSISNVEAKTCRIFEIQQTFYGNATEEPEPTFQLSWNTNSMDLSDPTVQITYICSIATDNLSTDYVVQEGALFNHQHIGKPIDAKLISWSGKITNDTRVLYVEKCINVAEDIAVSILEKCRDSSILATHYLRWIGAQPFNLFYSIYCNHSDALDTLIDSTKNQLLDNIRKDAEFWFNHPDRHINGSTHQLFIPREGSLEADSVMSDLCISITPQPQRTPSKRARSKHYFQPTLSVGMFHLHKLYYIVIVFFGYIVKQ